MDAMFFIVLGATLVSFLLTLAFGRFVIPMLRALHAGQSIREVGPQWHNSKAGTPTMGGIMFIAAILLCTVGFGWKSMVENADYTHLYVLGLALCYGLVGFADDFVKVKLKRNLGLTASQKFLLQLVVAVIFLFVLLVRALLKYLRSGEVRKEKTETRKTLGEALKARRTACKMTQEFVAEAIGVSRQAVSKWESGGSLR